VTSKTVALEMLNYNILCLVVLIIQIVLDFLFSLAQDQQIMDLDVLKMVVIVRMDGVMVVMIIMIVQDNLFHNDNKNER